MAWTVVDPEEQPTTPPPEQQPPPPATPPAAGGWQPSAPRTWMDTANDFARVASNTLTYGQWDRARAGLDALTTDKTYADSLKENVTRSEKARENLGPFVSGTADVIGGVAGGSVLAKAGGLATGAVVNATRPLWQRAGIAAAEGAAHGAAQGAGQTYTGDPADYAKNAGMGAILGGTVGAVSPVIGAGAGRVSRYISDRGAISGDLSKAAAADAEGLRAILRGDQGPRAMIPDAGPSMLGTAQGAVTGPPGAGKSALIENLAERNRTSAATISGETNRILGPSPEPSYVERAVRERMTAMSPEYRQVLNNAQAVDTNPIALHLEGEIGNTKGAAQTALRQVRDMLDIPTNPGTLDPNPRALQATRAAVRDMRDDPNATPEVRAQMGRVYDRITREMHDKIPGIRELDSRYLELGNQERGIRHTSAGGSVFDTGQENVIRPRVLADTLAEGAQPKGTNVGPSAESFRLSQAGRAEIDRIIGTKSDDLRALENVLAKPHDYNTQKLVTMFGQERADALARVLAQERQFRDTHTKVVGGSQTAQRLAAEKSQTAEAGKFPMEASAWGTGGRIVQNIWRGMRERGADAGRNRIAQILSTNDPVELQQVIPQLLSAEPTRTGREAIVNQIVQQGVARGGGGLTGGAVDKQELERDKRGRIIVHAGGRK